MKTHIHPEALSALKKFKLPEDLAFGKVLAPIMIVANYVDGKWQDADLLPYGPITIEPTAKVLHYGQEIFEGMKAYRSETHSKSFMFRPLENWKRFNKSATRMGMPEMSEEEFMGPLNTLVSYLTPFIPRRKGESLYLRPFMFATEQSLGIKPSDTFSFMIVASPVGSYFSGGTISVLIEREFTRAAPGGMGAAKTGGNYAGSLISAHKVKKIGANQTLWLDVHKENVQELSGMNFFMMIDGVLTTPPVSDTILDGITRKSILQLAKDSGIPTAEKDIAVNELKQLIKDQRCTEAFACGTAAIITPIDSLVEETGEKVMLKDGNGPMAMKLRNHLLEIQEGKLADTHGWVTLVEPAPEF
jgi:branched-chain amino acid aminotransferase